jgi:hypothetical protein
LGGALAGRRPQDSDFSGLDQRMQLGEVADIDLHLSGDERLTAGTAPLYGTVKGCGKRLGHVLAEKPRGQIDDAPCLISDDHRDGPARPILGQCGMAHENAGDQGKRKAHHRPATRGGARNSVGVD